MFHTGQHDCGTNQTSTYPIKDDFLRAAESQDIPFVDDLEDLSTGHGAEHWMKWINRDVRTAIPFVFKFCYYVQGWH